MNGLHEIETSYQFFSSFCFLTFLQQAVLKVNTAGGFHCLDDHRRESTLKDGRPEADSL